MTFLSKLVSQYLSKALFVPCLLLTLIVTYDAIHAYSSMKDNGLAIDVVDTSKLALSLVHEVQKERGLTAGYLGAKGSKFGSELKAQRLNVDKAAKAFSRSVEENTVHGQLLRHAKAILTALNSVPALRTQVDNLDIELSSALKAYTAINIMGLDTLHIGVSGTSSDALSKSLSGVLYLSSAKESSGIERAVLTNVFSAGRMNSMLRSRFQTLLTKQEVYLSLALGILPDDMSTKVQQGLTNPAVTKINPYREEVQQKDANYTSDAAEWFAAATARINALKALEDELLTSTQEKASRQYTNSLVSLTVELLVLFVGLLVTFLLFKAVSLRKKQSLCIEKGIRIALDERDLKDEIDIISRDELGTAAGDINKLTRTFFEDLMLFKQRSANIKNSSAVTAQSIDSNQNSLASLQQEVSQIAASAEELQYSIQSISQTIESNVSRTESASRESHLSKDKVANAVKLIAQTSQDMEQTVSKLSTLNEKVESISSMVGLIRGIAEQTNLLALNAAIEAARAGEQGRGFAVVADEVRSLASRTQQATGDIASFVEELLDSAAESADMIERSHNQSSDAAAQAHEINESLTRIDDMIAEINESTQLISESSKEQTKAVESITNGIIHINEVATENVRDNEKVLELAKTVEDETIAVNEIVQRYKS